MQIEPIGYLGYKLYKLGWQSALHGHLAPANHWLLSIFLYYRRGFTAGANLHEEYWRQKNLR